MSRKTLKLNTPHREEVKRLQKCLHYLINAPIRVDGDFGANTAYWTKMYQNSKGLGVDGVVGKNTYKSIEQDLESAKKFIVTIGAGHGGIVNGKYTTYENGKGKYYIHKGEDFGHIASNPSMFCEGVHNRQVGAILRERLIEERLKDNDLYFIDVSIGFGDEGNKLKLQSASLHNDRPLEDRVNHVDKWMIGSGASGMHISLHSNAGKARGIIVFTNTGTSFSDFCSMHILRALQDDPVFNSMQWKHKKYGTLPYIWVKDRADYATQKSDHEKRFYILRNLENKPYSQRFGSILLENDFFDNLEGAKFINDPANQRRYVEALVQGIKKIKEESLKRIPKI